MILTLGKWSSGGSWGKSSSTVSTYKGSSATAASQSGYRPSYVHRFGTGSTHTHTTGSVHYTPTRTKGSDGGSGHTSYSSIHHTGTDGNDYKKLGPVTVAV